MQSYSKISRRRFLRHTGQIAASYGILPALPVPGWAANGHAGIPADSGRNHFNLNIAQTPITIGARQASAIGINGSVPGPLLRFREGERISLGVGNHLDEDTSLHWHGLLLPYQMDGVPGVSFSGIRPGTTFHYEFTARQSGTYWYHSHSGLQEQLGVYGPIIIDPAAGERIRFDRDFVVLLSDWTFEDPARVFANLKKMDMYYQPGLQTLAGLIRGQSDRQRQLSLRERTAWAGMRMSPTDIADVTGRSYSFLMNGRSAAANWTAVCSPGERVRLRFINGSAMTFFNVRIPGLDMQVVQADGQNVQPVSVHEFQIGVAETYDVIIRAPESAHTIMAEAMDRSGYVRGTISPMAGASADVPPLRDPPLLTMADMGMQHDSMSGHQDHRMGPLRHDHARGPGVANLAAMAQSRLDHPGLGLDGVGHKVLCYADLRSLERNADSRKPEREIELHLTGNMHRYMWSFDGLKFSEVTAPIRFRYGERLRMVLVNDTMMSHPIHLHGMFVELANGNGAYNPRKHTVVVKPAERVALDITANEPGHWAFHCHLLYHMKAGMMQTVRVADGVVL